MVVVAASGDGFPETVADVHRLVLLGVFHVGGEGQSLRVVRDEGGEIVLHQAFEARAVAIDGNGSGFLLRGKHEHGKSNDRCDSHMGFLGGDYKRDRRPWGKIKKPAQRTVTVGAGG